MLTEKSKNALSALVLESLNSVFGTDKSKR
jgi:hypothetical protein